MLDAHIVKARRAFTVDVRIKLQPGERLGLFGASGAGKSTILSCLAGIETPDAGEIYFRDSCLFPGGLPLYRRPLAYLTQSDWLFPHLSVAENVCFGLRNHDRDGEREWIEELAKRLDLKSLWNESAWKSSGGQARPGAPSRMRAPPPQLVL